MEFLALFEREMKCGNPSILQQQETCLAIFKEDMRVQGIVDQCKWRTELRDIHENRMRDLVQFQMRNGDPHPAQKGEREGGKE